MGGWNQERGKDGPDREARERKEKLEFDKTR